MFERFDVPGLYLANTASLTAHAAGVLDGVVLECGHHATFVAPVYDGVALRHAIPKVRIVRAALSAVVHCISTVIWWRLLGVVHFSVICPVYVLSKRH